MKVVHSPAELKPTPRAVALGTFDGVHLGHRQVIDELVGAGLRSTVVTFDPHPRVVFGNQVELISSIERRLELLGALGVDDTLVVEFTLELARQEPGEFVEEFLRPIGTEVVVAGTDFRFGRGRQASLETLAEQSFETRTVELLGHISSTRIRDLVRQGRVEEAAPLLSRAVEVEGVVVTGDARGGTLGFPTANLRVAPNLLVPAFGIYVGAAGEHRAAMSIGMNPHYGGRERRVEAHLLDFEGDLYGRRLVLELWQRLRDEQVFESEADLIEQIARDVESARNATPPI